MQLVLCSPYIQIFNFSCSQVNGNWSSWSGWTCEEGLRQKLRSCNNPAPKNGGKICEGESKQIDHGDTESCKIGKNSCLVCT